MTELYFKLISVVLVLTMVFSLSATAFAADFDFHPDESITILTTADIFFNWTGEISQLDIISKIRKNLMKF